MANQIVEQLRQAVNAKHSEALQAIKLLAGYLEEPLPEGGNHRGKRRSPRAGTGKIRNAVITAFRKDYLSIDDAVEASGKSKDQVRGVVSAPSLKDSFNKKEVDGVMHYKYKGEEPE